MNRHMDSLPLDHCHRTHYQTLDKPNLAKSSVSVMSLGDKDQYYWSHVSFTLQRKLRHQHVQYAPLEE